MKVPSSELRIQICKCIVDFYHAEPPKKHIPGDVFNGLSVITLVFMKQNILSYLCLNLERWSVIIGAKTGFFCSLKLFGHFKQKNFFQF